MENSLQQRVRAFIKYKNITVRAFELEINVSNGYVNGISSAIGQKILQTISLKYPDLNTGWLLTGEGNMIRGDTSEISVIPEVKMVYSQKVSVEVRSIEQSDGVISIKLEIKIEQ